MQWEPWWDQHWVGAQNATSNVVRAAIRHISHTYPYWNRTNGADHFLVYSYDRGVLIVAPDANALPGKAITFCLAFSLIVHDQMPEPLLCAACGAQRGATTEPLHTNMY